MNESNLYTLNGPVQAGDGVYIRRQTDDELLALCQSGKYAYVLAPRQIGKSSLMAATASKLREKGIDTAIVDLTSIGRHVDSAEQWYFSFLRVIHQRLRLKTTISTWWQTRAELSSSHRLISFFQEVVLSEISGQVVVFVDEIDSTLSLPFNRDDFFAAIRAMYNTRTDTREFRRLAFVLIGTATPNELIADPTRTPFNIGQRVDLTDFTLNEALPLAEGLGMDTVEERQEALKRIIGWTGGQPYLTQGLCGKISRLVREYSLNSIDRLVEETYLNEKGKQDVHFQFMRDMLTKRVANHVGVLTMYRDILKGQIVSDNTKSQTQVHLKLSGVVKVEKGALRVRNPIYARLFDQQWLSEQLPSLSVSERNILLETITNSIRWYFGDTGPNKAQRLEKHLDLDCQLSTSEILTSHEVRNIFVEKHLDRVLIVGEPGSGKSYLLHEIAEDLLKIARASPDAKIPLPLSLETWETWDLKYNSFASWVKDAMMRELTSYKEAADWVDEGRVILLLDGLDQVTPAKRAAGIAALEKYLRTERASVAQCAITCRQQEYWEGPAFEIRFDQIMVKPLGEEQIDYLLSQRGREHESLMKNHTLRELCRTPQILTIVLENLDPILQEHPDIPSDLDLNQIYTLVCEDRLRKIADGSRKRELIRVGLMALATKTKRAGLSRFTAERFDRRWLDSGFQRTLIGWVNKLLAFLFSLISLLVTWLVGVGMRYDEGVRAPYLAEFTAVGVWLGGWWMAIAGTSKLLEREGIVKVLVNSTWNFEKVRWRDKNLRWAIIWGLNSSVIGTAVAGGVFALLTFVFSDVVSKVFSDPLVSGGLAIGISSLVLAGFLLVVEHWRKPELKLTGWLLMGLSAGIGYGVLVASVTWLLGIDQMFLGYSILGTAIACGLVTGFCVASVRGIMQVLYEASTISSTETLEEQSIRQLTYNVLWFASKVALIISLTGILLTLITIGMVKLTGANPAITAWGLPLPIVVFFILIICFGLGSLVFYGGLEIVEHYVAKFYLYQEENALLRNLDYLLNIAVQMDILRKDGKLYKFRHDTMRDYFARGGWER